MLDAGMMGVFCALDFFLFYVFWEVMLLPMYFLIGIWGGPRREYAAIKFFLYTLFGSVLMLLAILALYFSSEPHTFDMTQLMAQASRYGTKPLAIWPFAQWGWGFQHVIWMALFIGFRHQDSGVPLSHVAARCPRRSAHGDLGHPRRRAAQDGHLRHPARQLRHATGGDGRPGLLVFGRARRLEHYLWSAVRHGAKRSEKTRGLTRASATWAM
jgi:hypothetical protein